MNALITAEDEMSCKKPETKTVNHTEARLSCVCGYRPGVLGGVGAQYLHRYQQRATFSHIEGELQVGQVLRALDFTQVHLSPQKRTQS